MWQSSLALYGLLTMNWAKQLAKMAGLCVMAGLLMGDSARSQELPHLPTIADCPPGYRLAVQDTADPMLPARQPDPNAGYAQSNQEIGRAHV